MSSGSILALDLATCSGWACAPLEAAAAWTALPLEGHRFLASHGTLDLDAMSRSEKLKRFHRWITALMERTSTVEVWTEAPLQPRPGGSISIRLKHELHTIVAITCLGRGIDVPREVYPTTIKAHVANGRATKDDMIAWARRCGWSPQTSDDADALALLDYAIHHRGLPLAAKKRKKKSKKSPPLPLT